ncbi:MAG: RraA family protein [Alphaproteobacteria bacterium]|nr:RraA family protein [Alphaproteobacteria bacterium]
MAKPNSDADNAHTIDAGVTELKDRFFCALISDVLDGLGYTNQALSPNIRPLDESLVLAGRARTMLYADVYAQPGPDENHYELEIGLVDDLGPGDVVVAACGKTGRIAPWGGLLSTAATVRGATGAVMDGYVRDIRHVRELKLPVYSGGIAPLDSKGRGKVIEVDVPVECGGVLVHPGDIVFGDADGCIIIPKDLEAAVIEEGRKKLAAESKSLSALQAGKKLTDVYNEFGVL